MEIVASIREASKEYKTGDTVITALQPTSFDFMKKELKLIVGMEAATTDKCIRSVKR
jgi:putative ABC transport system ATP-binding protein